MHRDEKGPEMKRAQKWKIYPNFYILCEPTGNNSFGETVCITRGLDKIIQISTSKGDSVKELLKTRAPFLFM